ncbi:MAG: (Fe-S)-binding protein [Anaerolineales bacterium]|nr:(Fe-S)-binding protein [Anaerolineales bacterium]
MLTTIEKIAFAGVTLVALYLTWLGVRQVIGAIARGHGKPDWTAARDRALQVVFKRTLALEPTFRARPLVSLFHGLVAWGFMFYLLVNIGDVLQAYISDFVFLGEGLVGNLYRLGADVLSVAVLVGMVVLMIRRYAFHPPSLQVREETTLHPKARTGIGRDSAIVGLFILFHVGARFVGESLHLAQVGPDAWQPFASAVAGLWTGLSPAALEIGRHTAWWVALGLILAFLPYFPQSKHIHLFFAPLNYLLRKDRSSIGQLNGLDFEDASIEQFGAARMEDLSYSSIMDAYACIMCNRCQDACPAYATGKVLSPAALEINKRYYLNEHVGELASGAESDETLLEFAISPEAVWACTACGACNEVCPVGNEPMQDILEIRRNMVLMENEFPEQLQTAYRGMERTVNPWNVPPDKRIEWAEGLDVATVEQNPDAELLWWVGCAPATDNQARKTARAFARVLNAAGVDFAILGTREQCTGDPARRSGHDYLFYELATGNVETLNEVAPKRIVTTCPHCLHTILNEYPDYGGHYEVVHHTQLLQELIDAGRIQFEEGADLDQVTFHDPCYLGRQNGVVDEPRKNLTGAGFELTEMPRNRQGSFCCGAGGAQMWKEEEPGRERVSESRLREAKETGADKLAVGCPFCMIMLGSTDSADSSMEIFDVAELIADRMEKKENGAS